MDSWSWEELDERQRSAKPMLPAGALLEFLDDNLEKSKAEQQSNPLFMAGWIAALMHVKVNFLQQQNSDGACR